jgi:hypothetical protein
MAEQGIGGRDLVAKYEEDLEPPWHGLLLECDKPSVVNYGPPVV